MMHEIIKGSETFGLMFGGQQRSLVLSVSISTRKAIQAVEQVEMVFGGQQDSNYSSQQSASMQEMIGAGQVHRN